jgi:hypothetical protein
MGNPSRLAVQLWDPPRLEVLPTPPGESGGLVLPRSPIPNRRSLETRAKTPDYAAFLKGIDDPLSGRRRCLNHPASAARRVVTYSRSPAASRARSSRMKIFISTIFSFRTVKTKLISIST